MTVKFIPLLVGTNLLANLLLVGCSNQMANTTQPPNGLTRQATQQDTVADATQEPLYLFVGKTFINLQNEERQNFIPEGYELVSYQHGTDFPEYLIFRKNNKLYRYTAKTHELDEMDIRAIAQDERPYVNPSVSDTSEFLISIHKGRPVEGMIDFEIDSTQRFYYHADDNTSEEASDTYKVVENYTGCHEYDSKQRRIFIWTCGEGLGSVGPINMFSMESQEEKPYLTNKDLGLKEDDIFRVWFDHGGFSLETGYWGDKTTTTTFSFVGISGSKPQITTFIFSDAFQKKIDALGKVNLASPYSILWIKEKNILAIGFANGVYLATIDGKGNLTDAVKLNDDRSYVNYMYDLGNKLFYRTQDGIRVINLDEKKLEKTIELQRGEMTIEEVGLIRG
jgi:hypothetical protein